MSVNESVNQSSSTSDHWPTLSPLYTVHIYSVEWNFVTEVHCLNGDIAFLIENLVCQVGARPKHIKRTSSKQVSPPPQKVGRPSLGLREMYSQRLANETGYAYCYEQ